MIELSSTLKLMRVGSGVRPIATPASRSLVWASIIWAIGNGVGCHTAANPAARRSAALLVPPIQIGGGDSPPVVKRKIGNSDPFISREAAGISSALGAAEPVFLGNASNARRGAGLIKPAPFESDTALAAVKDASRRCAVGLRPILDRGRARYLVDDQAGTKKRLPSRTKKQMIVSGSADRTGSRGLV